MVVQTGQCGVRKTRISSLPHPASHGVMAALPVSELWVDVDVNGQSIPIPKQALYAAASDLRSASGGHVRWEDCASAVALVLSAMDSHGALQLSPASRAIPPR